jgi:hypothetical protein
MADGGRWQTRQWARAASDWAGGRPDARSCRLSLSCDFSDACDCNALPRPNPAIAIVAAIAAPPLAHTHPIMSDAHASDDDVAHQPPAPASEQGDTPRDTVEDVGLGDDDNDDDDDLFGDGGDLDDEPVA